MSAAAPADPPLIVGRYALFDVLASGGMATVHIGRLLGREGFGRTVAVKRLHTQFTNDPDFVTMFMDEARIVARIRHPNVVPMVDVIETPKSEGQSGLFLVMEYVHGETFSRLLRSARNAQQPVPVRIIASIMHGALLGLHSAHETRDENGQPVGIVHRDVSPQNIIVGSDGISRVLDFGVAKAAGRAQVTREGQIKGKLAYMSPEQIRGTVDRRADVFAVAVCLWEALTGRRLHEGARDVDIVLRVMSGNFPRPSAVRPDVPPALDEIIMRGLAADPANRYPNAREMALDLERRIGLAPASEVGPWVERLAADQLRVRSERIGAMEQAAVTLAPANSFAPPPMPAAPNSEVTSGVGTPMGIEVPVPARRRKGHGAIIALSFFMALAMIGGILIFLALSRGGAPTIRSLASASATTPATTPSIVPAASESATPAAVPAPSASAARSAAPSASSAPVVVPRPPPTWNAPAPAPAQKKKCDPYTIDAQGHRKYNLECIDGQ